MITHSELSAMLVLTAPSKGLTPALQTAKVSGGLQHLDASVGRRELWIAPVVHSSGRRRDPSVTGVFRGVPRFTPRVVCDLGVDNLSYDARAASRASSGAG